jgi:hypothetical protein
VRPGNRLSFLIGIIATVFQKEILAFLACAKKCMGKAYAGSIYLLVLRWPCSFAGLEALRVMSELVWECQQALFALLSWNKVMLL